MASVVVHTSQGSCSEQQLRMMKFPCDSFSTAEATAASIVQQCAQQSTTWLYGHKESQQIAVAARAICSLLNLPGTVAFIGVRTGKAGGTVETIVDLFSESPVTLEMVYESNGVVPIASSCQFAIPDNCFQSVSNATITKTFSKVEKMMMRCDHSVFVHRCEGRCTAIVCLCGFVRNEPGNAKLSTNTHLSLSKIERMLHQALADRRTSTKTHISFFESTSTRLFQCFLTSKTPQTFVLCVVPSREDETAATIRFGNRIFASSVQEKCIADQWRTNHRNSCDDAARVVQRWWRHAMLTFLKKKESDLRALVSEWEESEFFSLLEIEKNERPVLKLNPKPPATRKENNLVKRKQRGVDTETQTVNSFSRDASVGVTAQSWPRRSVGVSVSRSSFVPRDEYDDVVAERDEAILELQRLLSAKSQGSKHDNMWRYILEKNSAQRARIEELESELQMAKESK